MDFSCWREYGADKGTKRCVGPFRAFVSIRSKSVHASREKTFDLMAFDRDKRKYVPAII